MAIKLGVKVMTSEWVYEVWKTNQIDNFPATHNKFDRFKFTSNDIAGASNVADVASHDRFWENAINDQFGIQISPKSQTSNYDCSKLVNVLKSSNIVEK